MFIVYKILSWQIHCISILNISFFYSLTLSITNLLFLSFSPTSVLNLLYFLKGFSIIYEVPHWILLFLVLGVYWAVWKIWGYYIFKYFLLLPLFSLGTLLLGLQIHYSMSNLPIAQYHAFLLSHIMVFISRNTIWVFKKNFPFSYLTFLLYGKHYNNIKCFLIILVSVSISDGFWLTFFLLICVNHFPAPGTAWLFSTRCQIMQILPCWFWIFVLSCKSTWVNLLRDHAVICGLVLKMCLA